MPEKMIQAKDKQAIHQHRKDEHLSLATKQWENKGPNPWDEIRLVPSLLPELSLAQIDDAVALFGDKFSQPFYIEAMTGGTKKGDQINEKLAELAKNLDLAMAVGSQSIAIKYPDLAAGFEKVRKRNPKGYIFANLSAGAELEDAKRAVSMLEANALELHINVAQELTMKDFEGDRVFYWLERIDELAHGLDVPVVVKEVGFGMSSGLISQLSQTAISAINVAGQGGTDFEKIERERGGRSLAASYGLTGVESLLEAKRSPSHKPLIASGGISKPEDILKAQLLGAKLVGVSGFILSNLTKNGIEATEQLLANWQMDLKKLYLLMGAKNWDELQKKEILLGPKLSAFQVERQG